MMVHSQATAADPGWARMLYLGQVPVLVRFTQQLARFVDAPSCEVEASNARTALVAAFEQNPRLRSYILDEQGCLRKHVAVFVDGQLQRGEDALDAPIAPSARIDVMQALSGG